MNFKGLSLVEEKSHNPYEGVEEFLKADMAYEAYQDELREKLHNAKTSSEAHRWGAELVLSALSKPHIGDFRK